MFDKMLWELVGSRSLLSLKSTMLIYKTTSTAWSYYTEIWATSIKSNIKILEIFLHKYLSAITGESWYITNSHLCQDQGVNSTFTIIKQHVHSHLRRHRYLNLDALILSTWEHIERRLQLWRLYSRCFLNKFWLLCHISYLL